MNECMKNQKKKIKFKMKKIVLKELYSSARNIAIRIMNLIIKMNVNDVPEFLK